MSFFKQILLVFVCLGLANTSFAYSSNEVPPILRTAIG